MTHDLNEVGYRKEYAIEIAHKTHGTILPDGQVVPYGSIKTINDHINVIGTSGCGKTRSVVIPNILSAVDSMVISDMKGNLYKKYGEYLRNEGYEVIHLDFIHPSRSMHYDPIKYIRDTNDVQNLSYQIVFNGPTGFSQKDPFWDRSSEQLLNAIIGYIIEGGKGIRPNISGISQMLSYIDPAAIENNVDCKATHLFREHKLNMELYHNTESWAYTQYEKFFGLAKTTMSCVIATIHSIISVLDTDEMRMLTSKNDFELSSIGQKKTAVFIEASDIDRSKDTLINLFYSQAMNELCEYADSLPNSRLPNNVRFILDDFGTSCRIEGFENMISNIRSRGISVILILQSLSQLDAFYGEQGKTIIDNCDTTIYMGGNNVYTADYISKMVNKPLNRVLSMSLGNCWIMRRGEQPRYVKTMDLGDYKMPMRLIFNVPGRPRRNAV